MDIRPEWAVVEQIPFASLAKLSTATPAAEDVTFCGSLQYYDKAYDRITPKEPRPLQRTQRAFRSPSTSDDPVIQCAAPCTRCPLLHGAASCMRQGARCCSQLSWS